MRLAHAFAEEYCRALDAADQKTLIPEAWKKVFTAMQTKTSVLEDLVLAMTAHIVHDLSIALTMVKLSNERGESYIDDFHRMNDVLADQMKRIEDVVLKRYASMLRWIDHLEKGTIRFSVITAFE